MAIAEYPMLKWLADLMLGAACRAANLVADEENRLVLTPRYGGSTLPASPAGRA